MVDSLLYNRLFFIVVYGIFVFIGSHTNDRIVAKIDEEIKSYELQDKVCGVVTDNGANFCLAVKRMREAKLKEAEEKQRADMQKRRDKVFSRNVGEQLNVEIVDQSDDDSSDTLNMIEIEIEMDAGIFPQYRL